MSMEYLRSSFNSARITELTITSTSSSDLNSASSSIHKIAIGYLDVLIDFIFDVSSAPLNIIRVPVGTYRRDNGETRSSQCASAFRNLIASLSCSKTESRNVRSTFRVTKAFIGRCMSCFIVHTAAVVLFPELRPPFITTVV